MPKYAKYVVTFVYAPHAIVGPFESRDEARAFGESQDNDSSATHYNVREFLSPEEFWERRKKHRA